MNIGVFAAHEQYGPTELLDHATRAEAAGFDTVWTSDHFHPWWHTDAHCGAAWPWLGAALERTDEVRMGTGVTPAIGRYHPGLIAQTFATLATMAPGRVHLTLATGEAMNERPLGYDWPDYPERNRRMRDACEIITRLWDGERLSYDGHHWSADDAKLYTLPEERPRLFVAANGPKSARVAGEYADGLLTLVDPETYREKLVPAIEAGAEEAGRDPDDIDRIRQFSVSYADDPGAALDAVEFWTGSMAVDFSEDVYDPREVERRGKQVPKADWDDWGLITDDPAEVREVVDEHREAGFDEIEFLSTSPDQARFIDDVSEELEL
ncbi:MULTISPECIES: TIGR03557 family F420-dependent LLM class oxidoreductase [Halolamina]|uniref:Coenzyme F420-dependent glucose-6-phosphate dehydrogenase n=1 Tax=Halolamina pelagica TaxID=699431 RepID=A0A1I5MN97_9EURY|nr:MULTISPECIES: TIGR03557 family F420-dependent LLM class oxidoreductase [Halolamina]NHX36076.1 TIGR03557 family F420-dependent LLM class oxidoreductase [Halolamina sp. R1-12]SFP10401.1 coenzyme F420-dependent glucose-6-phosphate dehydrogenase [Halolamina pelagica]